MFISTSVLQRGVHLACAALEQNRNLEGYVYYPNFYLSSLVGVVLFACLLRRSRSWLYSWHHGWHYCKHSLRPMVTLLSTSNHKPCTMWVISAALCLVALLSSSNQTDWGAAPCATWVISAALCCQTATVLCQSLAQNKGYCSLILGISGCLSMDSRDPCWTHHPP